MGGTASKDTVQKGAVVEEEHDNNLVQLHITSLAGVSVGAIILVVMSCICCCFVGMVLKRWKFWPKKQNGPNANAIPFINPMFQWPNPQPLAPPMMWPMNLPTTQQHFLPMHLPLPYEGRRHSRTVDPAGGGGAGTGAGGTAGAGAGGGDNQHPPPQPHEEELGERAGRIWP